MQFCNMTPHVRTLELKLVGPSLVACGAFFAFLRILFCTIPSCCKSCSPCCKSAEADTKSLIEVRGGNLNMNFSSNVDA